MELAGGGARRGRGPEVADLGAEFERLGGAVLGARTPARVALLFDWDSWWAVEMTDGLSRLDDNALLMDIPGPLGPLTGVRVDEWDARGPEVVNPVRLRARESVAVPV